MWDLQKFSDNIAMVDEFNNTVKYGELLQYGDKISAVCEGRCLVIVLCRNVIASVIGYVSLINNHIVPILLNADMDSELMGILIDKYKPKYIWCPDDLSENVETLTNQKMDSKYNLYGYSLLKTNYKKEYPLYDELALLLTTSGSTGSPKFVRQSYDNILANAKSIVEYLKLDATEKPITTLPMNYTYGLSIINSHLLVGATLLVTSKSLMQKEFWAFFRDNQATSFGGVPYTYEILKKLRFMRMDLPSLRTMTQAGGKLLPELHAEFAEYAKNNDKHFVVMYGQCEATARMGYLPYEMAIEKKGSMGIAIPGGAFSLIDEQGNIINEANMQGELVYEGKNVTLGYAECGEDLSLEDERHGILKTGDMAKRDEDGYYYIVGRKKRFLKIYGNRVNLDEVDRLIKAEFEGIDCASSGVDDHMTIFVTDDKFLEKIKQFVTSKTKLNQNAFSIIKISEIPKNDAGKVLYKELEKYL